MYKIIELERVDSTNKYAKENLQDFESGTIIYTNCQTNGKGRENRVWTSTENSLTFSLILKDQFAIKNFDSISILTASSVFITLKKYIKKRLKIKWPNDIYYNDSKICGILLESVSYGDTIEGIVIGIGLNVNNPHDEFKHIDRDVTSLFEITKNKYELKVILEEIIDNFNRLYNDLKNSGKEYYKIITKNDYLKKKCVYASIGNKRLKVTALGINKDNKLKVKSDNRVYYLSSDEITFH